MTGALSERLDAGVECLLFVADGPLTTRVMADALRATEAEICDAIQRLSVRLAESSGLQVVQIAGGYQLSTKPVFAEPVASILQPQKRRLTKAALETLAVIAYRQPITLAEIETVRGVACDGLVRSLVERDLVKEMGRRSGMGRPILYGTTRAFLHLFGLNDLAELPPEPIPEREVT